MKVKNNNADEMFADAAVGAIPEAKELLFESTGIHSVLALSLADIYTSEAKRFKAKYGSGDPRVAEAKLKKTLAAEHAKEMVDALVKRRSPVIPPLIVSAVDVKEGSSKTADTKASGPAPPEASRSKTEKTENIVKREAATAKAPKAPPKPKPKSKTKVAPGAGSSKVTKKKAPARKARKSK
jgi:hypothetical protein